jgi:TBC1 domain family protein 5
MFNPLAPVPNPSKAQLKDRETKELIKQDVLRTLQEFEYFKRASTRDTLTQILYLWAAEHPDPGYKQGMNELLAVILIVFDTERSAQMEAFDPVYLRHDTYMFFDALMQKLRVVDLY